MITLMNGDIYIKIKPDMKCDVDAIKNIDDELIDLRYEEGENGITEETEKTREKLEILKEKLLEGKPDYTNMEEFYILKITQNLQLIHYDKLGHKFTKLTNIQELKEKYISLLKFLIEAEYVGKEFIRTKPIYLSNKKLIDYMNIERESSTKILYKTDYAMLAIYLSKNSCDYYMLNPQYFIDGQYNLISEKHQPLDKKQIYKKVVAQINNRHQYYEKYYKNK